MVNSDNIFKRIAFLNGNIGVENNAAENLFNYFRKTNKYVILLDDLFNDTTKLSKLVTEKIDTLVVGSRGKNKRVSEIEEFYSALDYTPDHVIFMYESVALEFADTIREWKKTKPVRSWYAVWGLPGMMSEITWI